MAQIQIGLAKKSLNIQARDVENLAVALQTQVRRDLQAAWAIDADVLVLADPVHPPPGVWPIFIVDQTPGNFAGLHTLATNAIHHEQTTPWAMVSTKRDWQLAASHECLEMLVDPSGVKTVPSRGLALDGQHLTELDLEFQYLLEVCDPIEDDDHAYDIGGVVVSDFYTPSYFDREARPGARYSFNGALTRPREVRPGGYLSWRHPNGKLQQLRNFAGYELVDLAETGANVLSRPAVDQVTQTPRLHPEKFQPA